MLLKKFKFIIFIFLLYQSPLYSKSNSLNSFNSKYLSNYFSGIVAYENQNNSEALKFFNSSKILTNKHNPYLQRYIYSLVIESKVQSAVTKLYNNTNNLAFIKNSLNRWDFRLKVFILRVLFQKQ